MLERRHLSPAGLPEPVDLSGGEPAVPITELAVPADVTVTSAHQQDLPVVQNLNTDILVLSQSYQPLLTVVARTAVFRPPNVQAGNVLHPARGPIYTHNLLSPTSCDEHLLVLVVRYGAGISVLIKEIIFRDH